MKLIQKPDYSYSHEIENKSFFSFLILLQKSEKRGWRRIPGREESKRREKFQRDSNPSSLSKRRVSGRYPKKKVRTYKEIIIEMNKNRKISLN